MEESPLFADKLLLTQTSTKESTVKQVGLASQLLKALYYWNILLSTDMRFQNSDSEAQTTQKNSYTNFQIK